MTYNDTWASTSNSSSDTCVYYFDGIHYVFSRQSTKNEGLVPPKRNPFLEFLKECANEA